jgi:hypothetical protein
MTRKIIFMTIKIKIMTRKITYNNDKKNNFMARKMCLFIKCSKRIPIAWQQTDVRVSPPMWQ